MPTFPGKTMALFDTVAQLCADLRPGLLDEHFRRLPVAYFERYSAADIARHCRMLDGLGDRVCAAAVTATGSNAFEVLFVGRDQVGVLAGITSLLMNDGLSVQDLHVATYADEEDRPAWFVDSFRVTTRQQLGDLKVLGERLGRRLPDMLRQMSEGLEREQSGVGTQSNESHHPTVIRRDELEGQVLDGRYRLRKRLAMGGMSVVYVGEEVETGRPVALKILRRRDDSVGDEMEARFIREAETLAAFDSHSIVKLIGAGVFHDSQRYGRRWMALEYLPGGDLDNWVKQFGPAPVPLALRWLRQCLEGLAYAHERGVLHRDLKPHNLLLSAEGDVQLSDFGLLKAADGPTEHTIHGTVLGTPQYMPPEQALGEVIDERSDIYSLGVTFYKIFSGRLPYEDESPTAVFAKIVRHELPSLSAVGPELSGPVSVLINRMIARRRDERYQYVDVLLADLASFERRGILKVAPRGWSREETPLPVLAARR